MWVLQHGNKCNLKVCTCDLLPAAKAPHRAKLKKSARPIHNYAPKMHVPLRLPHNLVLPIGRKYNKAKQQLDHCILPGSDILYCLQKGCLVTLGKLCRDKRIHVCSIDYLLLDGPSITSACDFRQLPPQQATGPQASHACISSHGSKRHPRLRSKPTSSCRLKEPATTSQSGLLA